MQLMEFGIFLTTNRKKIMNKEMHQAEQGGLSHTPVIVEAQAVETILVVIDMQPGYPAALAAVTQWFVKQEIQKQMEQNLPVILVEFDAHEMGETLQSLRELLAGYKRLKVVSKSQNDGSTEVIAACRILTGYDTPFRLRVCGVNSDACVLETVQGLSEKLPLTSIVVPQDACNCLTGKENDVWVEDFPALPNVVVELHARGS